MNKRLNAIVPLIMLLGAATGLRAEQRTVTAAAAWIEAPAAGATAANAYVSVDNPTMYEVYVVSATSPAAEKIEIRGAGADAAITEVSVPAYGSVELKPGGTRLVLTGLKRPLKAGEKVALTLTTDGGAMLTVTAEVRAAKPAPVQARAGCISAALASSPPRVDTARPPSSAGADPLRAFSPDPRYPEPPRVGNELGRVVGTVVWRAALSAVRGRCQGL